MNRTPYYNLLFSLLFLMTGFFNPLNAQTTFEDFPWLNNIINTADCCQNQNITAYQSGIFTFVYIEKGLDCGDIEGELYFQDGTFYCTDVNGMDCRAAYGLTEDNATLLWECAPEMSNVFTICLGDSVFLPAIQDFPVPPLPPAGPNGESIAAPCHPQLSRIEVVPAENSTANGLKGFFVAPTETTFYELVSSGNCGGPDAANFDEQIVAYEVIVEKNCISERQICDNIFVQEWASNLIEQECTGNIYNITYDGQPAIYVSTLCACLDDADVVYDCKGNVLCSIGGLVPSDCGGDLTDQLTTENLIWAPECDCPCPLDLNPVCGADGQTYDSACEATCAGVEILDNAACDNVTCPALERLSINFDLCNSCMGEIAIYIFQGEEYLVTIEDNPICSDGITTVTNCDSTSVFCFNGGIAGFSQCNDFFEEAELKEVIFSRKTDCEIEAPINLTLPCTYFAGVDFGLCEAVMGVGVVEGKCQTISGCLNFEVEGIDYSEAFFPTVEICQQTCGIAIDTGAVDNTNLDIFDTYEWLAAIVDVKDCNGTTVEVYDFESFSFVHVQTAETGELYFGDGTFYCMDLPNYDCRALYNLTEETLTETFVCGGPSAPSGPSSPSNPAGGGLIRDLPTTTLTPSLKAFPNPTSGFVTVDMDNRINEEHTIRVFDLFGRLIEEKTVNTARTNIDLSSEDAGIYLIETWDGTNRIVQKLIKQ